MRYMGHNVLAIAAAAIVIYAIEFVIFGVLISPEQYEAMVGLTSQQMHPGRMPIGLIMPILIAVGLALVIKWRNAAGWMGGLMTGLILAVLFAFPVALYSYVYGSHADAFLAVDLAHYLVCWGAGGAIIGAWK